jgi:hypothetical protein
MRYWNVAIMALLATWAVLATWRLESIPHGGRWLDAMGACPMYRAEKTG